MWSFSAPLPTASPSNTRWWSVAATDPPKWKARKHVVPLKVFLASQPFRDPKAQRFSPA